MESKEIWVADWTFKRKLSNKDVLPYVSNNVVTPLADFEFLKNDLFYIRRALRDINTKQFIMDTHGFPKVFEIKFIKKVS